MTSWNFRDLGLYPDEKLLTVRDRRGSWDHSARTIDVYLPHQCDEWDIVAGDKADVKAALQDFIDMLEAAKATVDEFPDEVTEFETPPDWYGGGDQ